MHSYRTHNCNELNKTHVDQKVKLSGWIYRRRDHANVLFVDLRDHFGTTQIIFDESMMEEASRIRLETVITVVGKVVARSRDSVNKSLSTGEIEVIVSEYTIESLAEQVPFSINTDQIVSEELRLKYRFLDLRRDKLRNNIILRSKVIREIREFMHKNNFMEFQTPILTASSPEGARDFLVPSRLHKGKFYALPQAPQQFKQLLMVSGFDKYFQIAPCFRDEDSRADRAPGEFYQLDVEMSFVIQEDIFGIIEPLMKQIFSKFSKKELSHQPFSRIRYDEAMLLYGSDKPDLRNPIEIADVTDVFEEANFPVFKNAIKNGAVIRAIPAPLASSQPRSFFDKLTEYAISEGSGGLGYIQFYDNGEIKGPIVKFLEANHIEILRKRCKVENSDTIFFVCDSSIKASKIAGKIRSKLGTDLNLINNDVFKFCWIVDFPFYELNEDGKLDFSHNPFSMPQGGMDALENAQSIDELLSIRAYQYDIVCNGIELSSGAIRNHRPDLMYKAFEIVGYSREEVDSKFKGMITAFKFGAPPHGGIAPGIDRMIMLLADADNIREVIAFPMNQQGEDLMMNAPSFVSEKQMRELGISVKLK